jgi:hypothetical protein
MRKIFFVVTCLLSAQSMATELTPGQWELTKKNTITMSGKTRVMPEGQISLCLNKEQLAKSVDEGSMPQENIGQKCTVVDQKPLADGMSYHMTCSGERPTDIVGENHVTPTSFVSKMTMNVGEIMISTLEIRMRRVGGC